MKVSCPEEWHLGQGEAQIAPSFEQAEGKVLRRTETGREGLAKEAAVLDQLAQQMRDLQKEVKDFGGGGVLTIRVFQRVAPILLDIKVFIFDLPAESASFVR